MNGIGEIISTLVELICKVKEGNNSNEDILIAEELKEGVNKTLFETRHLKMQKNDKFFYLDNLNEWIKETSQIISIWIERIEKFDSIGIDNTFWDIYYRFKYGREEEICENVISKFKTLPQEVRHEFKEIRKRYYFIKNQINEEINDYSLIEEYVNMLASNADNFKWLYDNLADYRSKKILIGIVQFWFDFDIIKLNNLCENIFDDYYDLDIVNCCNDEVFVDLGAYTGDSIFSFINTYKSYGKIYAYELTPSTMEIMKNNLKNFRNIEYRDKAIGNRTGTIFIKNTMADAGNNVSNVSDTEVEITTLDEDIKEKITLVKMDIEGSEKEALEGAYNHIINDRPKLMVSAYHISSDIFSIPRMIHDMRQDYKFYLRYNGHGSIWPCDYVIFAV